MSFVRFGLEPLCKALRTAFNAQGPWVSFSFRFLWPIFFVFFFFDAEKSAGRREKKERKKQLLLSHTFSLSALFSKSK